MPELPEVESARLELQRAARGKKIKRVNIKTDPLVFRYDSPAKMKRALTGRKIKDTGRHGKYFWAVLDGKPWPFFHFGMSGSLHTYRDPEKRPKHWKMEWILSDGLHIAWNDPRRFGRIRLIEEPPIGKLGFDVLVDLPSPKQFQNLLRARKRNLKALLLDQSFSAGVGNWIADEVLYQSALSPKRVTTDLSDKEIERLRVQLRDVVRKAVHVNADSEKFPEHWLFHHRWSSKVRSLPWGKTMIRETVAGRTTAWVPDIQK